MRNSANRDDNNDVVGMDAEVASLLRTTGVEKLFQGLPSHNCDTGKVKGGQQQEGI